MSPISVPYQNICIVAEADPGGVQVSMDPPSPPKEGSRTPTPKIKKIKLLQSSYRRKSYIITKSGGPTTTSADQRGAVSHF